MDELNKRKQQILEELKSLGTMDVVPRQGFLLPVSQGEAYDTIPLQTISQIYIFALMVQTLSLSFNDRILDKGTGSRYVTAIIHEIAKQVYIFEYFYKRRLKNEKEIFSDTFLGFLQLFSLFMGSRQSLGF